MSKRRKKKTVPLIYLSTGPLPARISDQFADHLLVFSDASLKRHGGMAAVLFENHDASPLVLTKTIAPTGSNELELLAAIFALQQAETHFPNRQLTLFTDNLDAADRLIRCKSSGFDDDPLLASMFADNHLSLLLAHTDVRWIRSHASCRGNALADQHARQAAETLV